MAGIFNTKVIGGKTMKKKRKNERKKRIKRGGSVLADIGVPAGLLFLNEFLKRKSSSKKVKFSKKSKVTKKAKKK